MTVPKSISVTVIRARGLRIKGKNGTNNAFVTISLGKEKFQTSVQSRSVNPEWNEEAELSIPKQGNTATLILTVYHSVFHGVKEHFLGEILIQLFNLDLQDWPCSRWFRLRGHGGKSDGKERGELEIHISFIYHTTDRSPDVLKSKSHSLQHLSSMVHSMSGSMLNLNKDKIKMKNLVSTMSSKIVKLHPIKKTISDASFHGDDELEKSTSEGGSSTNDLSHSRGSSMSSSTYHNNSVDCLPPDLITRSHINEVYFDGFIRKDSNILPEKFAEQKFCNKWFSELGSQEKLIDQEKIICEQTEVIKSLQSYIDKLLLHIMETNPSVLEISNYVGAYLNGTLK